MKVDVYKNLNNGRWSIRSTRDTYTRTQVLAHAVEVSLYGAEFKVSQAGRARVLQDSRKNVHAVVRGVVQQWRGDAYKSRHLFNPHIVVPVTDDWIRVSYNPYLLPYFFNTATLDPVYFAEYANFTNDGRLFVKLFDKT